MGIFQLVITFLALKFGNMLGGRDTPAISTNNTTSNFTQEGIYLSCQPLLAPYEFLVEQKEQELALYQHLVSQKDAHIFDLHCFIVLDGLIVVVMGISLYYQWRARDDRQRHVEGQKAKYEGIIEEKEKQIQELQKRQENEIQEALRVQAQQISSQQQQQQLPIVYVSTPTPFPGMPSALSNNEN